MAYETTSKYPLTKISEFSLTRETDNETVARLERMFAAALRDPVWQSWREHSDKRYKFYEGEQWTAFEEAILRSRGQPIITENLIKPKIDRLIGQSIKSYRQIHMLGRNAPMDVPQADTVSDLFRWVDQINGAEFEDADQAKDGFISGFGVCEAWCETDETGEKVIRYRSENPFYIFPDPHSRRYDWNEDAKYLCRSKWIDIDDALALWPKKQKELRQLARGGFQVGSSWQSVVIDPPVLRNNEWTYTDQSRQRLRPVEVWYKRRVVKRAIMTSTGISIDLDYLGPRQALNAARDSENELMQRVQDEMWLGVYCAGILLHHERSQDQGMFRFIPYFADRRKSGEPIGPVANLVSLNEEINKRRSKALHLMANNQAIVQENSVQDWAEFANEKAKPDGIMKVRNIEQAQLIKNADMGQAQMVMHAEAKSTLNETSGIGPEALGQASEVRSGIGIARKQLATDLVTMPLFQNLRRTLRIKAMKVWELIAQHLDSDLVFQITNDPAAAKTVNLPKERLQALKELKFDMVISEQEDSLTVRAQQFETVAKILPQILPLGVGPAKFLLELSDIRPQEKQGLLQMLDQMSAKPPADPKISIALTWSDLTPEEKAVFAAKTLNMPELAQYEMQQGEPSGKKTKIQRDMAVQQSKERMNEQRQQVELIKHGGDTQIELVKTAEDAKIRRMEAQDKRLEREEKAKEKANAE